MKMEREHIHGILVFIIGVENKRRTGCSLFAFLYRKKAKTAGGFQKFSLQERQFADVAEQWMRPKLYEGYSTQFSTDRSGTRSNSQMLFVIRIISSDLACAAISISNGPISVPLACRQNRISPQLYFSTEKVQLCRYAAPHNFFVCNGNYAGLRVGKTPADAWGLLSPVLLRRGAPGILDA